MSSGRILFAAVSLAALMAGGSLATAQTARPATEAPKPAATAPAATVAKSPAAESAKPPAAGAAPAATAPAAAAQTAAPQPADLVGFRSARFGMDEAAVRAAIEADFGKEIAQRIQAQENLAEKTKVFSVLVPDLLEGAGTASVSYVFGYKTKKLIQVVLLWSPQTDPQATPERLFSSANILQGYFAGQGYQPGSVVTGAVVDAGILMFRGADKDENTAMLLLQGSFTGDGPQKNLTPTALVLYYIDDAKNPDVFRIQAGKF